MMPSYQVAACEISSANNTSVNGGYDLILVKNVKGIDDGELVA